MNLREKIQPPYLLFIGDAHDQLAAKTALGLMEWRRDDCLGKVSLKGCNASVDLPELSIEDAVSIGVKTLVIGLANRGGKISDSWLPVLCKAAAAGLDIANGLHDSLQNFEELVNIAQKSTSRLFDIRKPPTGLALGTGKKRTGKRILMMGTDCSCGKKFTALSLTKAFKEQNIKATFRATGQTGILISGSGIAIDAVPADFITGAAEVLSPNNNHDHWDVIEGQASLLHPSYAGMTLGLLLGSQPDHIIICHRTDRKKFRGTDITIPDVKKLVDPILIFGSLVNPNTRISGISLNSASKQEFNEASLLLENELNVPIFNPATDDLKSVVNYLISLR